MSKLTLRVFCHVTWCRVHMASLRGLRLKVLIQRCQLIWFTALCLAALWDIIWVWHYVYCIHVWFLQRTKSVSQMIVVSTVCERVKVVFGEGIRASWGFLCFRHLVCFWAIPPTVLDVYGRLFWRKHTLTILNINLLKQSLFWDVPFRVGYLFVYDQYWNSRSHQTKVIKQWPSLKWGAPRSEYAVRLCLQDHSLPWSQSMVSFLWLCNWAMFPMSACSQL